MTMSEEELEIVGSLPPIFETISKGTIIRAYSPRGCYWHDDLLLPTAQYANQRDLILTACHFDEGQHVDDFYTDFDYPLIEEIRLLAALTLPISLNDGAVGLYPLRASLKIQKQDDLRETKILLQVADRLRELLDSSTSPAWVDGPLPPAFGGPSYQYRDRPAPVALHKQIFDAIDPADHLLIRGLATLIKFRMLATHYQFMEEAFYPLYVSLDASFGLVMRKLLEDGVTSPSSHDAQTFIENVFSEEPSGMKYFEEYYEDRIKVVHPDSRFGVFPYATVGSCDYCLLFEGLREVYRYLVLGKVADPNDPSHLRSAALTKG